MSDDRYNGWANRETWLVNLWISNEEGSQEYVDEMAAECLADAMPDVDEDESISDDELDDVKHAAIDDMAGRLESMHDEAMGEMTGIQGVMRDLLAGALGRVDWREIAEHYIDDAIAESRS